MTAREVEPNFKDPDRPVRGVCPTTGEPKRQCKCRPCIGRRSREKGKRKQLEAAKGSLVPTPRFASQRGHEENFRGPTRLEVKAGQQVQRIATLFLAAEKQSEDARAIGDDRPFEMVAMPDGWPKGEGIVLCRLSKRARVVEAYVNWD